MQRYHDVEWGVPERRPAALFELLSLEGAQAGLSWATVLARREGYRRAFHGFEPAAVAAMGHGEVESLVNDRAIIRHAGKIRSVVGNARAICTLEQAGTDWADHVWSFVGGRPLQPRYREAADVPAQSDVSRQLSRDLMRRGFRFVGPTIAQAFLQAAGLTNDHLVGCFRHDELSAR